MDAYSATRDASVDDRLCALRPKGVFDILWSDSGLRAQNLLFSPLGCSSAQQRTKRVCSVEYVVNKKRARWISIFVKSYGKTFARDPNSAECLAVSGLAILVNGVRSVLDCGSDSYRHVPARLPLAQSPP